MTEPTNKPTVQHEEIVMYPRFLLTFEVHYMKDDGMHACMHEMVVAQENPAFTANDIAHIKFSAWEQTKQRQQLPADSKVSSVYIVNTMFLGQSTDEEFSTNRRPLQQNQKAD